MPRTHLGAIIGRLSTLPTISPLYGQVTGAIEDPRTSAEDVGVLISRDALIAASLLRMVNSAFFGYPERVTTVTRAVTIAGLEAVHNLVLATSVFSLFDVHGEWNRFSPEHLWQHSLATAVASRTIARRTGRRDGERLFVAGLIHDIGKIALLHLDRERYLFAVELASLERLTIEEAEQRVLGHSHREVGSALAQAWHLPPTLVAAIADHQEPPAGRTGEVSAIVHVADIVARALGLGSGGDDRVPHLSATAWAATALTTNDIEPLLREVEESYPAMVRLAGHRTGHDTAGGSA